MIICKKKVYPSAQNEVDKHAKKAKLKTTEKSGKKVKNPKDDEQIDSLESDTEQNERSAHPRRNASTKEVWASYEDYTHEPNRKLHPCLLCQKRGIKIVSKKYFLDFISFF